MSSQYIYTMYKLNQIHPPNKTILKNISLNFYPKTKINVLNLNNTNKSTLLQIITNKNTKYQNETQLAPGTTIKLLEQEPHLNKTKDIHNNIKNNIHELHNMLNHFNKLTANYSNKTTNEFTHLQNRINATNT